jgi:hypothetical protein
MPGRHVTRTAVHRRDGQRAAGSQVLRTPTAGRHAELLALASSVGNRRMAQIARQPWPWYGPPMLGDEEEEDLTGMTAPSGLDLGFLDDPIPSPPPMTIDIPAPAAQHTTTSPGAVRQQATDVQLPAPQQGVLRPAPQQATVVHPPGPQHAVHHAAPQPPPAVQQAAVVVPPPAAAPVVPAAAPAPAPNRLNELNGLDDESQIKRLTKKVDELLGANLVTVTAGTPYRLGNPRKAHEKPRGMVTIEVVFTVKARAGGANLAQFVAHYHPGAEKASVGRAASSQMHIKKWADADKFNRDEDVKHATHPNLNKVIPKLGPTTRNWENLPVAWGLRK